MVAYLQGRQWLTGDALDQTNLQSSAQGGIVHALSNGGLLVDIEPLRYILDSTSKTFGPVVGQVVAASKTLYIYVDNANTLQISETSFPISGSYYALAIVTTNATSVLQVIQISQAIDSAASGVTSLTANSPLVQTGPASAPVIDLPLATGLIDGAISAADFSKLAGIESLADVTDTTNVAAAGAAMQSLVDVVGDLLVGSADNVLTRLAAGAAGEVLTSSGPGVLPSYQSSGGYAPQVLIAQSTQGSSGILPYNAAEWVTLFSRGTIAVDLTNINLINLLAEGLYIAVAAMYGNQNNRIHQLQFNSPPNPGTDRGNAFTNLGGIGVTQDMLCCLGAMEGPGQVALETSGTNFGAGGVDGTALRSLLIIMKVSD